MSGEDHVAGHDDTHDPLWGEKTARITTILTLVLAALFVGAVLLFIL